MSNVTKQYKKKYKTFQILSVLLLFLPVGIFVVMGFIQGTTAQKLSLGVGMTLSLLFTAANVVFKLAPRSGVWILIMALTVAMQKIQNVIYITGVCVILEECVTSKLEKYYRDKYKINREIDDRFDVREDGESEGSE